MLKHALTKSTARTRTVQIPNKTKRDGFSGDIQRYRCNTCGNRFSANGHAAHKQFSARQIADAIDSYYSGMSYKQVAENMADFYEVPEPSKRSIHDWVKGYTRLAQDFLDGKVGEDGREESATGKPVKAKTGDVWVADEIFLRVGGEQMYCWNVMDKDSRYILATHLSRHRGTNDAIAVMEKALAAADKPPKKITTDGLERYVNAIRAVFPRSTEHEVSQGIRNEFSNNISERLQGSYRQRTKTQRGLQSRVTGQDYLDGWTIDYNFFKPHHTLKGKAPAEVAGMAEQVPWGDSWEDIARMGGEVAEPELKETIVTPNKPGPKPDPEGLKSTVEEYLATKQASEAKAKRRAKNTGPVTTYPRRQKGKSNRGRGLQTMRE